MTARKGRQQRATLIRFGLPFLFNQTRNANKSVFLLCASRTVPENQVKLDSYVHVRVHVSVALGASSIAVGRRRHFAALHSALLVV